MIEVSCAIIKNSKSEIFVAQRSAKMKFPLKWEFPGGKIEKNETAEICLIREIKEELNVEIIIEKTMSPTVHDYDEISVHLFPFVCLIKKGDIKLLEHINYLWVQADSLPDLDWAEADLPILKEYLIIQS